MKIIADKKIPFLKGVLEPFTDIEYYSGSEITKDKLADTDALIIRTRTRCDAQLLEGTPVKFIASATIGYDHIDIEYCRSKGISWTNAPGCNSGSVMQYLAFVLLYYANNRSIDLRDRVLGVVGVGNVGKKIVRLAEILEMQVLLNDPPRERNEGRCGFISLNGILREADILSFHVPLVQSGIDKTFHMVDEKILSKMNPGTLLINSSRGEVINTEHLKKSLLNGTPESVILDVWEHEPTIDKQLLENTFFATSHIAGYSADGKANGTKMAVQAVSRFFNLGLDDWEPDELSDPAEPILNCDGTNKNFQELLSELVFKTYNFLGDEKRLRENFENFELIRENYPLRREFNAFSLDTHNVQENFRLKLKQLGFRLLD
jgi:erythronate-4-phosphate dehydrogenase